jgi:hypothetical protein
MYLLVVRRENPRDRGREGLPATGSVAFGAIWVIAIVQIHRSITRSGETCDCLMCVSFMSWISRFEWSAFGEAC